jgi:6-phosphogluconolactonase
MQIEIFPDVGTVARRVAEMIAQEARAAISARGVFVMAVSGGRTPWLMLREFSRQDLPWEDVHVAQVDERAAPAGHADRNLTYLRESLEQAPLPPEHIHAMPVEQPDLNRAAELYAARLRQLAGTPPVLDLVHLGLGSDGHTASLVPNDPVLDITDADVAVTGIYQGRRRMTLTYPILNRARRIVWVVTGEEKAGMLRRLLEGDASIPAGRIRRGGATVIADVAAAGRQAPPFEEVS